MAYIIHGISQITLDIVLIQRLSPPLCTGFILQPSSLEHVGTRHNLWPFEIPLGMWCILNILAGVICLLMKWDWVSNIWLCLSAEPERLGWSFPHSWDADSPRESASWAGSLFPDKSQKSTSLETVSLKGHREPATVWGRLWTSPPWRVRIASSSVHNTPQGLWPSPWVHPNNKGKLPASRWKCLVQTCSTLTLMAATQGMRPQIPQLC